MKKAVGYVRVSTEEQAREGVSLEAQDAKVKAYAEVKDWELLEVVEDEGRSAKDLNRPGMVRVLAMVEAREVDAVIVYKLDRLTRSVVDVDRLISLLEKQEVALVSIQENLDTSTATGRLMINLLASVSQWEREVIGERTREALGHKKDRLESYGSEPYGYTVTEDGKLEENEEELEAVSYIRELRAHGLSYHKIAERLNEEGVPTKRGGSWYAATVSYILKNRLYKGVA